ncbi:MAG: glucose 1-dehydrogenase [Anaerolineae bacterium]|nr:glucose 1-dehydrogenase [Anaerolineae bacterium]
MDTASVFESIRPRYPEFKDQVAIVTGSSRGIGKGIALRLAREGMKVVIHGINREETDRTTQELAALGVKAIGATIDFSLDDAVDQLFQATLDAFGTVDLLVNNAADLRRTHIDKADAALFDTQMAVNVRVPYLASLRAAAIMRPKRSGNIISISSVGGARAHWAGLPYDVTKGAIDSMTQAMSLDLASEGIRVNAIAPGAILSERSPYPDDEKIQAIAQRIPMVRFGKPLEIGAVVAFLASEDASYITGQVIYVDGALAVQLGTRLQPV